MSQSWLLISEVPLWLLLITVNLKGFHTQSSIWSKAWSWIPFPMSLNPGVTVKKQSDPHREAADGDASQYSNISVTGETQFRWLEITFCWLDCARLNFILSVVCVSRLSFIYYFPNMGAVQKDDRKRVSWTTSLDNCTVLYTRFEMGLCI